MADIGALPTKNSVRITSTTGDFGTIPAATASAAGVMTADHVKKLEAIWQWHQTLEAGGKSLVIQAPTVDTSNFPTRMEIQQALAQLPRGQSSVPDIAALRSQVSDLQQQLLETTARALSGPPVTFQDGSQETIDQRARAVLEGVIQGMAGIEDRLQSVETVIEVLRRVADQKASAQEAAA